MTWLVLGMIGLGGLAACPPDAAPFAPQAATSAPDATVNVPEEALREILRRGAWVERVGPPADDDLAARVADALSPPPDDSHKWFITLVVARDCLACEQMRADFEQAPSLAAWVDPHHPQRSWAHWQVIQADDASQAWRWQDVTLSQFPAVIVQPPINRAWGDPHTVVYLRQGYLPPDELAEGMRRAIQRYVAKLAAASRAAAGAREPASASLSSTTALPHALRDAGPLDDAFHQVARSSDAVPSGASEAGEWKPPVTPPPRLEPAKLLPNLPPEPAPGLALLLVQLVTALLSGQGTSNLLLLAILLWQVYRHLAKARGMPLLLSDEQAGQLLAALRAAPPADAAPPSTTSQRTARA
jgi:hypothetical protein